VSQQQTPPKDLQSTPLTPPPTHTYIPLLDMPYLSLIDDGLHKGAQSHCLNSLLPVWKNINFCMRKTLESWHTAINQTMTQNRYLDNILFFYEPHFSILFPCKYLFVLTVILSTSHFLPYIFQRSHLSFTICQRLRTSN